VAKQIISTTFPLVFFRMNTSNRSNERNLNKLPSQYIPFYNIAQLAGLDPDL